MCNRYSSTKNDSSLNLRKAVHQFLLAMRPNIAPTQKAPVVLMDNAAPVVRDFTWGWTSQHGPVTNARAETAAFKMFKDAWRSRRCIVPQTDFMNGRR
jgi:putative SOS response-associated peptidase YedK